MLNTEYRSGKCHCCEKYTDVRILTLEHDLWKIKICENCLDKLWKNARKSGLTKTVVTVKGNT